MVYSDTLHYLVQSMFFYLCENFVWVYRQTNFRRLHRLYFGDNLSNILICPIHANEEHYLQNLPYYRHDKAELFFLLRLEQQTLLKSQPTFASQHHVNRTRFHQSKRLGSFVLCIWQFLENIHISSQRFSMITLRLSHFLYLKPSFFKVM